MQTYTPSGLSVTQSLTMLFEKNQRPSALPSTCAAYHLSPHGTLFADIIQATTEESRAPQLLCIQAALGVGAFALQDKVVVERPNDGKSIPVSLLVIGIAKSGERKSSVMEAFMGPVTSFLAAQEDKHLQPRQRYLEEVEIWEKTRRRLVSACAEAQAHSLVDSEKNCHANKQKRPLTLQQAEKALNLHLERKPSPPASAGVGVLSDATPQAIPKFIKERGLRSLGIITPEGEEILTNGIKHKSSILNKGYSGEATQRYRVGEGDQSYDVPITTCIFVQPDVAHQAFGAPGAKMRGTGMNARALMAFPASTQGFRALSPPADTSSGTILSDMPSISNRSSLDIPLINRKYRRWISKQLNRSRCYSEIKKVKLKLIREAQVLWYQAYNECEAEMRPGGRYEHFTDLASKFPDQWLRVAGVIHGYNHEFSDDISVDTLRVAFSIVNAFSVEFERLFAPIKEEDKQLFTLEKYLRGKRQQQFRYLPKKVITANGPLRPVSRLDVALHTLSQRGEIGVLTYPRYNQRGHATRPITIIDLYPHHRHDEWCLQQAINMTYQLQSI
ncbi:DUF3987 domain-containing protein [Halomonas sp. BC04]|uniref:DUF3987 domain-containing protein n=1 Tax=Halomonas sp. BC04 TaxID=1403540 RepID=UPI0003ED60B8|nr:DUF3987 domain-containing protein [Halomonas sp. BC04]EWH01920.1 hypothetical protein Q427_11410 [Halomonas sp. BC04]